MLNNQIAHEKSLEKARSMTSSFLRAHQQKSKQLERLQSTSDDKTFKNTRKDLQSQIEKIENNIRFINSEKKLKDETQRIDKDMKSFFRSYSLCQDNGISAIVKILDIIPGMVRMAKKKTYHTFSIIEDVKLKASEQLLLEIQKSNFLNRDMRYELKKIQPSHVSPGFYAEISTELALKEVKNIFKYRRWGKK